MKKFIIEWAPFILVFLLLASLAIFVLPSAIKMAHGGI